MDSITDRHIQRCLMPWNLDSCKLTMAMLPMQQQWWWMIPASEKQFLLMSLNYTYPMNYLNQNYHKLFNLSQTSWDESTPPDWIIAQVTSEAQHTSWWKTPQIEECVHPSYGHQNSIDQHFNFIHLLSHFNLYLIKRLNNSLLNKSKVTL